MNTVRYVFFVLVVFAVFSCVTVDPAMKDGEASLNYGITLQSEGKIDEAIAEFKKARDFYDAGDHTFSAFATYPYIARAYYLNKNTDAAINTYFESLNYAQEKGEGKIYLGDLAVQMRDLANLLREVNRIDETKLMLGDLLNIYRELGDMDKMYEIKRELDEL